MNDQCKLSETDLVAYAAGDLKGARQEYVEAHVQVCPACRRRVEEYREIDRLLQDAVQDADIPDQRAAIKGRLAIEVNRQSNRNILFRVVRPGVLAAALVLLVLALAVPLQSTWADFRLARFIGFTSEQPAQEIRPGPQGPPGKPVGTLPPSRIDESELSFQPVAPEQLPSGLMLADQTVSNSKVLELRYRNEAGLSIRLIEALAGDESNATTSRSEAEIVHVGDTEVAQQTERYTGEVFRLLWEWKGVIFDLSVLESPSTGLDPEVARQIVEALIAQ